MFDKYTLLYKVTCTYVSMAPNIVCVNGCLI